MAAAGLLLQLAVIIAAAWAFGRLFQWLRQPAVIGEMIAGIVLGPSVAGHLFPAQHAALFALDSRDALNLIAQTGVILFMFVVGTRLELGVFRRHSRAIAVIAVAGIVVPLLLGAALAALLHGAYAADVPRTAFILFLATAMSVTAFPVLARIIVERGLDATRAGSTALVCAAINDLAAWVLVATVVSRVAGVGTVSLAVHGVFAAFAAGVVCAAVVPAVVATISRIEVLSSRFLLPVFFALTGLRTDLRLLAAEGGSWLWCAAIVATATVGKLGSTALAARWAGMPRAEALTLGALMNTRGLMELVVLNIGYELGLLPPGVFAMMVVMALVTTVAAGPLVDRWSGGHRSSSAVLAP